MKHLIEVMFADAIPNFKINYNKINMSKIDRLIQLVSDADEAYKQSVINILNEITQRIQKTRKENKDLEPDIDKRYWCETCGSHSHETNPDTGYCFNCNTDNWEPENYRDVM